MLTYQGSPCLTHGLLLEDMFHILSRTAYRSLHVSTLQHPHWNGLELDPRDQQIRYIGRSSNARRRHVEHKRHVGTEQPTIPQFDQETGRSVEVPWTTRSNWMFELQQLGLESVQLILQKVQPAAYAVEYERRYIWHAIQQGWPILNKEAIINRERVQASTQNFLSASFDVLVREGWFQERAIEAFLRAWYVP